MSERKENIIKAVLSAVLLLIAAVATKFLFPDIPQWGKALAFLPSYIVVGYEVLFDAAEKLFKGKLLAEEFLMSVATLGAIFTGDYPEATFVMLFFVIGETFEETAKDKNEKALKELLSICADKATVLRNGNEIIVDAKDVKIGETVIVKPGERIPLDGVLLSAETKIDTSAVTGEALPKTVKTNENVYSGTVNLTTLISIKTTHTLENSTASKILELIKSSNDKKAKTEKFITRFAKIYTPVVVAIALLIAVVPSIFDGNFSEHIYSALTVLVISCPCALVVSIPISFFGAIGTASRKGILVKGSDGLEKFAKLNAIAFDKTGTLTKGSFEVTAVHPERISKDELLKLAASAEQYSTHPIALSIIAQHAGREIYGVTDVFESSGEGITAKIGKKDIYVGSAKLMEKAGIEYRSCEDDIGTVVHIAFGGIYGGHIVISDKIKPQTVSCIEALKEKNIKTVMLTGDSESTAKAVANAIKIDEYKSSLLPNDKVAEVEKLMESGKITAFSGDGINDAPVLARADIGIAMGALGSDAAVSTADIVIMDDNIGKLPTLLKISKKTVRIAKENIIFSIGIKLAVLLLSALSVPHIMWFAAFSDAGVLVIAVLNSMRTMRG